MRREPLGEDEAVNVGIKALEFLAAEPDLLNRFLSFSGLSVEQLRREARRPAFFAALLDFILDHESTLQAFVARTELSPEHVAAARGVLSGTTAAPPP